MVAPLCIVPSGTIIRLESPPQHCELSYVSEIGTILTILYPFGQTWKYGSVPRLIPLVLACHPSNFRSSPLIPYLVFQGQKAFYSLLKRRQVNYSRGNRVSCRSVRSLEIIPKRYIYLVYESNFVIHLRIQWVDVTLIYRIRTVAIIELLQRELIVANIRHPPRRRPVSDILLMGHKIFGLSTSQRQGDRVTSFHKSFPHFPLKHVKQMRI